MNLIIKTIVGDVYKDFPISEWPFDNQGMGGDHPIFNQIISEIRPKIIVEVGSWKGQSAITMAKACQHHKIEDATIICIDTWLGSEEHWHTPSCILDMKLVHGRPTFYNNFVANMIHKGVTEIVTPLSLTSSDGADLLKHFNIKVDLAYIDGAHDYHGVMIDLIKFWDIRAENGVIFGHDISWPGVNKAVSDFCNKMNIGYTTYHEFWRLNT